MKRNFTLLAAAAVLFVLLQSNQGGLGAVQGADATGSPFSMQNCSNCHNGGSYDPQVSIMLVDDAGMAVDRVEPGAEYTLRLSTSTTGTPGGFGFQAVLLDSTNAVAGNFGEAPERTQFTDLMDITYWEQSRRIDTSAWEVPWVADESIVGSVNVYAIVNAVNGNNAAFDQSDVAVRASLTLPVEQPASINDLAQRYNFVLYPNQVDAQFNVSYDGILGSSAYKIVDVQGRIVQSGITSSGSTIETIELSSGMYFFALSTDKGNLVGKFLKQ